MSRMRMLLGGALVLGLGIGAFPVQAQRGQGPPAQGPRAQGFRGDPGPHLGRSLELALSHEEELGLNQDQVTQLQALKTVVDEDVGDVIQEMNELRDAIRSGDVPRQDGYRQMEALRGELIQASAPLRGRVQEILTAAQHQTLQGLIRPAGAGVGRGGAMGGARGPGAQGMGNRSRAAAGRPGRPAGGMGRGSGFGGGRPTPPFGAGNGPCPLRGPVMGQGSPGGNGPMRGDFPL